MIIHDNLTCVRGYCSIFGAPMNRPLGDNNIFVGILINVIPYYLRFYYPQIIVPLIAYIGLLYNFPQKENVLFEQLEQCHVKTSFFLKTIDLWQDTGWFGKHRAKVTCTYQSLAFNFDKTCSWDIYDSMIIILFPSSMSLSNQSIVDQNYVENEDLVSTVDFRVQSVVSWERLAW